MVDAVTNRALSGELPVEKLSSGNVPSHREGPQDERHKEKVDDLIPFVAVVTAIDRQLCQ